MQFVTINISYPISRDDVAKQTLISFAFLFLEKACENLLFRHSWRVVNHKASANKQFHLHLEIKIEITNLQPCVFMSCKEPDCIPRLTTSTELVSLSIVRSN